MIVARRIIGDIRRRGLTAGDKLPAEQVMLEDYQVGRGTLRESLRFLELQNVISLRPGPGGGPSVEKPDASTLATALLLVLQFDKSPYGDVVESRRDLEPLMARLAAARISPEQIARLEQSVSDMEKGLHDLETFLSTNIDFHEQIAWASANSVYGFLIEALQGILDGTVMGIDYPERRRMAILVAHKRILTALKDQDGDASFEAMDDHINEYQKFLSARYPHVLAEPVSWI